MELLPAILATTKEEFSEKLVKFTPHFHKMHLDIADGIFVPNTTIDGIEEMELIDPNIAFEVHLMVSKPENHVGRWLNTSAETIIFHIEAASDPEALIRSIKEGDKIASVALNPETPISAIEPYIGLVDVVQFMAVKPGFYGSPLEESVIEKIKEFHYFYPDTQVSVDGSINDKTIKAFADLGVTTAVIGSYFGNSNNIQQSILDIEHKLNS